VKLRMFSVRRFYKSLTPLDFTTWFIMCCPIMLINLILAWLSLVFLFIGPRYQASLVVLADTIFIRGITYF